MMLRIGHWNRKTRGAPAGFTLIEMIVTISIIAILMATLLNRVLWYQEQAEKAAMEQTLGIMRSALNLQFANLAAQGRVKEVPSLVEQNPMTWLAQRPSNYLGEYYAPKPKDVVSGYWYFDLHKRNLIYSVNNNAHFHSEERNRISFKVKLVTGTMRDQGQNGISDNNNIEGVILEQVVPYSWF